MKRYKLFSVLILSVLFQIAGCGNDQDELREATNKKLDEYFEEQKLLAENSRKETEKKVATIKARVESEALERQKKIDQDALQRKDDQLKREQARQKASAERESLAKVRKEKRESDAIKIKEVHAREHSESQLKREEFAARVFSQTDFSPKIELTNSVKSMDATVEFRGKGVEKVQKAYFDKNWLELITLALGEGYGDQYPNIRDIYQAHSYLESSPQIHLFVKTNKKSSPAALYLVRVLANPQINFKYDVRSQSYTEWSRDVFGPIVIPWNKPMEEHPDGIGYLYQVPQSDLTLGSFVVVATWNEIDDAISPIIAEYSELMAKMEKKIELGELPEFEGEANRLLLLNEILRIRTEYYSRIQQALDIL